MIVAPSLLRHAFVPVLHVPGVAFPLMTNLADVLGAVRSHGHHRCRRHALRVRGSTRGQTREYDEEDTEHASKHGASLGKAATLSKSTTSQPTRERRQRGCALGERPPYTGIPCSSKLCPCTEVGRVRGRCVHVGGHLGVSVQPLSVERHLTDESRAPCANPRCMTTRCVMVGGRRRTNLLAGLGAHGGR